VQWVAFGTYDTRAHPRVAVLIEGLRAAGDKVTEINAPLGLDTAARVAILGQPWRLPTLALRLATCWLRLSIGAVRQLSGRGPDAVLVGYLGHFDVRLAKLLFRSTPIVLDHLVSAVGTASDRGLAGPAGLKARLLRAIDAGALGAADVVVVDTEEHAAALPDDARAKCVVVPVGATQEWFAAAESAPDDGPLRAIFVGLFTPLHGTVTLGRALAALAGDEVDVTMVGTGQDYAECRRLAAASARVTWLDWVPGGELPALVAGHHVCLGIFGTTEKAQKVVPTKVFQGAAAGCAIITSDTPPQRAALDVAALFVSPGDADALASALRDLAADRGRLSELRAAARARAVARFAPATCVAPLHEAVLTSTRKAAMSPLPPLTPNAWLRWDVLDRALPRAGVRDVLEIGCGRGAVGARLSGRYPSYLGLEVDPVSYEVAARAVTAADGHGEVRNGDLSVLDSDARFDLVCAFEVIEHIEDDGAALVEWAERLRPGGWMFLSTPAHQHRFAPADEMAGHFRRYDPPVLVERLRAAGLSEVKVVLYGAPLGYALEAARNAVGRRRIARAPDASKAELTSGSGRLLQPSGPAAALATRVGTAPFRLAQRVLPGGVGLIASGRRP